MTKTDFERPPVIETALSVEFPRVPNWRIPHYGLLWSQLKERFPGFDIMAPIPPSALATRPGITIQAVLEPDVRLWLIDRDGTRVLQIQPDRFVYNWRKVSGGFQYPHYDELRPAFAELWSVFTEFLRGADLEAPQVIERCEVTYVNAIPQGDGWQSWGDLSAIFPYISGRTFASHLPAPTFLRLNAAYAVESDLELHITLQPAMRAFDNAQVIQLNLTARSAAEIEANTDRILQWMDRGQKLIVDSFVDFTSEAMHKQWGMHDA